MSRGDGRDDAGVEVPVDLREALETEPSALDAWRHLRPDEQRGHIASLEAAPDAMARARCVTSLVHELGVLIPRRSER